MNTTKVIERYLPGKMEAMFVCDTILIDPDTRDVPYKYDRLKEHEIEHVESCPFDLFNAPRSTQSKYEHMADRAVAERHMPVSRLVELVLGGCDSIEELSEAVELDCEFVCKALEMYVGIYGYDYRCGDYIVNFMPLSVMRIDK